MPDTKQSDYIAHVRETDGLDPPHDLVGHLAATAALAGRFGASFGASDIAELGGYWHDLGKFRPGFQRYVRTRAGDNSHLETCITSREKTHSAAGACHAIERFGTAGRVLAYLIAGHHGGLRDWHGGLDERLGADNPDTSREYEEASAAAPAGLLAEGAVPDLRQVPGGSAGCALWLRMLFSCLVDADFLDTEAFMDDGKSIARQGFPSLDTMAARFDAHMEALKVGAGGTADTPTRKWERVASLPWGVPLDQ